MANKAKVVLQERNNSGCRVPTMFKSVLSFCGKHLGFVLAANLGWFWSVYVNFVKLFAKNMDRHDVEYQRIVYLQLEFDLYEHISFASYCLRGAALQLARGTLHEALFSIRGSHWAICKAMRVLREMRAMCPPDDPGPIEHEEVLCLLTCARIFATRGLCLVRSLLSYHGNPMRIAPDAAAKVARAQRELQRIPQRFELP